MRVGITTSLIRIGQIKNADLNLILADTAFSLLCSVAFALLIALIGGIVIRTAGFYSITAGKQKRRRQSQCQLLKYFSFAFSHFISSFDGSVLLPCASLYVRSF